MTTFADDKHNTVFAIPVHEEWTEIVKQHAEKIFLAVKHRPRDLPAEWAARGQIVGLIADILRECGEERPIVAAWKLVDHADAKEFARKIEPGQPLGDLTADVIRVAYKNLIRSRLKRFRLSGRDWEFIAEAGLYEALVRYDRRRDAALGSYAKWYIDKAIKDEIRGHTSASDIYELDPVSGDLEWDDGGTGERWDTIAQAVLSDATVDTIENSRDKLGRLYAEKIPLATALWIVETNPPYRKPRRVKPFQKLIKAISKISTPIK